MSRYSAAWVRSVGLTGHLHADFGSNPGYGIPYTVVPVRQPRVKIAFTGYGDESDPGPYPVPPTAGARPREPCSTCAPTRFARPAGRQLKTVPGSAFQVVATGRIRH